MENQKTSKSLGEVVFTGVCLVVGGLILFSPGHHLHGQKAQLTEPSEVISQEEPVEERVTNSEASCEDCIYEEQHYIIAGKHYALEVADTEAKRALGLGNRDTLCEDCGMLFILEKPTKAGFWMKNMRFSIDILWIKDGKIIYKKSNASPEETETFTPPEEADSVIEILPNTKARVGGTVRIHTHDE